jgi:hypothetical protein
MVLGLVGACLPISKPRPGRDIAEMEKWSRENLGPRINLLPASHLPISGLRQYLKVAYITIPRRPHLLSRLSQMYPRVELDRCSFVLGRLRLHLNHGGFKIRSPVFCNFLVDIFVRLDLLVPRAFSLCLLGLHGILKSPKFFFFFFEYLLAGGFLLDIAFHPGI